MMTAPTLANDSAAFISKTNFSYFAQIHRDREFKGQREVKR